LVYSNLYCGLLPSESHYLRLFPHSFPFYSEHTTNNTGSPLYLNNIDSHLVTLYTYISVVASYHKRADRKRPTILNKQNNALRCAIQKSYYLMPRFYPMLKYIFYVFVSLCCYIFLSARPSAWGYKDRSTARPVATQENTQRQTHVPRRTEPLILVFKR
jgi:hypothetical protein